MTAHVDVVFNLYSEGYEIFTCEAYSQRDGFVLDFAVELSDLISPKGIETIVEEHERVIRDGSDTCQVGVPYVAEADPRRFNSDLREYGRIYVGSAPVLG